MTKVEFYMQPVISSYLPLTFPSGNQKYETFVVECAKCKKDIAGIDTRGHVEPIYTCPASYRETPVLTAHHVVAQGLHAQCGQLTTADYILRSNMTITGRNPDGTEEKTWGMRKHSLWERFRDWLDW